MDLLEPAPSVPHLKWALLLNPELGVWGTVKRLEDALVRDGKQLSRLVAETQLPAPLRKRDGTRESTAPTPQPSGQGPRGYHFGASHAMPNRWLARATEQDGPQLDQYLSALSNFQHILQVGLSALHSETGAEREGALLEEVRGLTSILGRYRAALTDAQTRTVDTAKVLGLSVLRCHKWLDHVMLYRQELLPLAYYSHSNSRLKSDITKLGGIYYLWMLRGDQWLQCGLHVRYPLEIHSSSILRAKLVIPDLNSAEKQGDERVLHYDGFVRRLQHRSYWVFQKRDEDLSDFLFLIAEEQRGPMSDVLLGSYLTSDQDFPRLTTAADVAILHRRSPYHWTNETEYEENVLSLNKTVVRITDIAGSKGEGPRLLGQLLKKLSPLESDRPFEWMRRAGGGGDV